MADNRIRLPSSEGGLMKYGEDSPGKFQLKPHYVIGLAIAIIIIFAYLSAYGGKIFGY